MRDHSCGGEITRKKWSKGRKHTKDLNKRTSVRHWVALHQFVCMLTLNINGLRGVRYKKCYSDACWRVCITLMYAAVFDPNNRWEETASKPNHAAVDCGEAAETAEHQRDLIDRATSKAHISNLDLVWFLSQTIWGELRAPSSSSSVRPRRLFSSGADSSELEIGSTTLQCCNTSDVFFLLLFYSLLVFVNADWSLSSKFILAFSCNTHGQ